MQETRYLNVTIGGELFYDSFLSIKESEQPSDVLRDWGIFVESCRSVFR